MICPICGHRTRVRKTRARLNHGAIYRKRQCPHCQHRFRTIEPHAFCPACQVKTKPYRTTARRLGRVVIRYRRCPVCGVQEKTREKLREYWGELRIVAY